MGRFNVDQELIRALAQLLDETGLTEIEVGDGDNRLRIAKNAGGTTMVAAPAPVAAVAAPATAGNGTGEAAEALAKHPGAVTSPMVGTAYRGPEPSAAPFVNVGDRVRQGDTVAIIEAMKTFNEIPAPKDGTITRILIDNGTPVEFGEVLAIIE
ncbi:MAG: acetyl-CoA carboxylase biotin carboxyl carrier protein [Alphaproteobacteria bacterium]